MDTSTLTELASRVADLPSIDGGFISHVEIAEMSDGSHRTYALVTIIDGDHEQTYRIISPAPWNSPAWASVHKAWTWQLRGAIENGTWYDLEVAEVA